MHRRSERGERNAERRHTGLILERDQHDPLFPVPAPHQIGRPPAETALAIVNQRGVVRAHRRPEPPRRRRVHVRPSGS